ncbi:alpha-ketoacid dehydrogenase subunit alpha/beta [Aliiglaciecola sp. LCG003]|uniref:dehydrogenase E1 component subunit alpha/beta n=1 Tax=Aliiglaciecola sp. LCG003 TaxID=3053655 RepID=UPI002573E0ED|nr:alpha-ketoacid dehydrogenase subunit alpha/beta [Aliiglaciecola sp. LCG003]WJG09798.1 thiamine pyrophosphate-dependent enzyme [Aliiglaciecola sp. LCG003]
MQDRNQLFKQVFIDKVRGGEFPPSNIKLSLQAANLDAAQLLDLFESQIMSRHLDLRSRELQKAGQSFYTIGSAGHEGNAAISMAFRTTDMAFLHYRSAAFVIQRAKHEPNQQPLYDMLLSFCASSEDPVSGGRHKVLGSKSLFIPPQTSTIASHLPKAVGTAFSLALAHRKQSSEQAKIKTVLPDDSVIICSFGDASANHSTAQGAFNTAAWAAFQSVPLPIVFVCEDNNIGISTATPKGWIKANFENRPGIHYLECDGLNLLDTYRNAKQAARIARQLHKPVFLHVRTVRLLGHAGSDSEFAYRTQQCIEENEAQDPLLHSAKLILDNHILDTQGIIDLYQNIDKLVEELSEKAAARPRLTSAQQIQASLIPSQTVKDSFVQLNSQQRADLFSHEKHNLNKKQHMAKLLNWALLDVLASYSNALIFGEDVGKKGGVYNVTAKLSDKFGPSRVVNTLLDEQSILGAAIGLAHNGYLPIPEIQFLAYVHNAEDQIRGEAATLSFFSNGQFTNPMVIRIAGLAYQRGFGGHFHNDNSFAVFRDIPGVIIACPSNGADAVDMFRTCVATAQIEQRVVIFIEPIALYMKKDLHEDGDQLWSFEYVPPQQNRVMGVGDIGVKGDGKQLCIISYGNGFYLSCQAQKELQEQGFEVRVVDLRWLAPLNETAIIEQVKACEKILIVDECRKTGSISEALMTLIYEHNERITSRRLTAQDCFIPLGNASYEVLPSKQQIIDMAVALIKQ